MAGAPVRSRRFFGPTALVPVADTLLYTVPGGRTAIFHALQIANYGAAAGNVQIKVNGTNNAAIVFIGSCGAGATIDLYDRIILNPGDTIYGRIPLAATMNIIGVGSLLDGAPS